LAVALIAALAACSGTNVPIGSGSCSTCERHDAGPVDAGKQALSDAGPDGGLDAGPFDAGPDSGVDGGPVDSGAPLTGQVCPPSSISFSGKVLDLCATETIGSDVPLDGVQVATLEPYSATETADGGKYTVCMPPGVPATLVFSAPDYVTLYMPEMILTQALGTFGQGSAVGNIRLPCPSGIQAYATEIPTLNPALPLLYVQIDSISNLAPCGGKPDAGPSPFSGWVVTASVADDGGLDDGGAWPIGYLDTSDDLQSVASSFATGEAVIYDIDPSADYLSVQATSATLSGTCGTFDPNFGFDGRIHVAPNAVSVYPWIVP
jgi:hypothetical protein